MKFKSEQDKQLFFTEIDQPTNMEINEELYELFLNKRNKYVSALKDFRRSQNMKRQWNVNRYNIMKGIKTFHKSTAGKMFHRALARFIATRILGASLFNNGRRFKESFDEGYLDLLKALSSFKTHAYIELEYYHPLYEQLDYEDFIDYSFKKIDEIENKVLNGKELDEGDIGFLILITETEDLVKALSGKSDKSMSEIEKVLESIDEKIIESNENIENYYKLVVEILKKRS